jgi:hypothetical protein
MLAQVFNPTEIKKNGPEGRQDACPAQDRTFAGRSAVLPATRQAMAMPETALTVIIDAGWWVLR